jgi:Zn-dependent metalloprotease
METRNMNITGKTTSCLILALIFLFPHTIYSSDLKGKVSLNASIISNAARSPKQVPGINRANRATPPNNTLQGITDRLFTISNELRQYNASSTNNATVYSPHPRPYRGIKNTFDNFDLFSRPDGTIIQMKAKLAIKPDSYSAEHRQYQKIALSFLKKYALLLKIRNPETEMRFQKAFTGELGHKHVRFHQYWNGIRVWPSAITVHLDGNGSLTMIDGNYMPYPSKPLPVKPLISAEEAVSKGLASISSARNFNKSTPELIYCALDRHRIHLAWKIKFTGKWDESWLVAVDAITGEILVSFNLVNSHEVTGHGTDLLGITQSIPLWQADNEYYVLDTTKPMFKSYTLPDYTTPDPEILKGGILILDLHHRNPEFTTVADFVTTLTPNSGILPDAVSASVNLSYVYDYYYETFHRNSIDGNGMNIIGVVRAGRNYDNAFWNGQAMFFGDADLYAAAIDVIGHELTHGITQYTANLLYLNESGALNEAFSDIFGEMIERYANGANDWLVSAALKEPIRDIADPASISTSLGPYPETMDQYYNLRLRDDNGGVHINSTIISHCFYLLAEGMEGAIGADHASRIFYRALTTHLVANSQFADARLAAITSAAELFGDDSIQKKKTEEAFDTVGIKLTATTPPPPSIPAIQGDDATVFLCPGPLGFNYYICRKDPYFDDPDEGVYLSTTPVRPTRFSVTKDGSVAMFVSSDNDICMIRTDGMAEACLGYEGTVHSAAMNVDGSKFAIIMLTPYGEPDNTINVLTEDEIITYDLTAPSTDAMNVNTILYADVLTFTLDSQHLIYDALNILNLSGGREATEWSIYAIDIENDAIFSLVSPTPGMDMGNPALSQTSDNFIVFFAGDFINNDYRIIAGNLNTGETEEIGQTINGGAAYFTGDDTGIIYDIPDPSVLAGISIGYQKVGEDRITPKGALSMWIEEGGHGTIYRHGTYTPIPEANGFFDMATDILRIYRLDIPDVNGEDHITIMADLMLEDLSLLTFSVYDITYLPNDNTGTNPMFDPLSGTIDLPVIEVTDQYSHTSRFHVILKLVSISDNPLFKIVQIEPI